MVLVLSGQGQTLKCNPLVKPSKHQLPGSTPGPLGLELFLHIFPNSIKLKISTVYEVLTYQQAQRAKCIKPLEYRTCVAPVKIMLRRVGISESACTECTERLQSLGFFIKRPHSHSALFGSLTCEKESSEQFQASISKRKVLMSKHHCRREDAELGILQ